MKKTHLLFLCLSLLLLVGVGAVAYATSVQITKDVIAGGGDSVTVGNVHIDDTIGQPVVGVSSAGDVVLESGYWHGVEGTVVVPTPTPLPRIYLPIYLK